MSDNKLIVWALVAIVVLAGVFLLLPDEAEEEPVMPPVTAPPITEAEPEFEPEPLPQVQPEPEPEPAQVVVEDSPAPEVAEVRNVEPEPEPVAEAEEERPTLNASDAYIREELAEIEGGSRLLSLLVNDEVIRKFVVFVENAGRGNIPPRNLPVTGPDRSLQVREVADQVYVMEPTSYNRFNMMIDIFSNVDTEQAVALYRDLEPLFNEAYAEIGYPDRDFTETLIAAIDNVLSARVMEGPFRLRRPNVMYEFEDPRLESLSNIEKLVLRLGPENATRLQERLRSFRSALSTQG